MGRRVIESGNRKERNYYLFHNHQVSGTWSSYHYFHRGKMRFLKVGQIVNVIWIWELDFKSRYFSLLTSDLLCHPDGYKLQLWYMNDLTQRQWDRATLWSKYRLNEEESKFYFIFAVSFLLQIQRVIISTLDKLDNHIPPIFPPNSFGQNSFGSQTFFYSTFRYNTYLLWQTLPRFKFFFVMKFHGEKFITINYLSVWFYDSYYPSM